jgi:hypothetical protein
MIESALAGACAVDSDPFEGDFTESGSAEGDADKKT